MEKNLKKLYKLQGKGYYKENENYKQKDKN